MQFTNILLNNNNIIFLEKYIVSNGVVIYDLSVWEVLSLTQGSSTLQTYMTQFG